MQRTSALIIVSTVLLSTCNALDTFGPDWTKHLLDGIREMNRDIQENVQRLNSQVQENVRNQLTHVQRFQENIAKNIENVNDRTVTMSNGPAIIAYNNGGASRTIRYGQTSDGQPYYIDSEDKIVGNTLYHTDRVYDPSKKAIKEHKYTLDLKDPMAKPVPVQ